jgi:hypothetical protein
MRPDPHSRSLRLHRLSDTPTTFFITKSLLPKKAVLVEKPDEWVASSANRKELVTDPWPWLLDEE